MKTIPTLTSINWLLNVLLLLFTGDEYKGHVRGTGRGHCHVGLQIRPNIGFVHIFPFFKRKCMLILTNL